MPRNKSKIPFKKEKKVKKAKDSFDRKIRKDKVANAFYAEELSGDGEIIERRDTEKIELKEKIKLDLLRREKRKDDLVSYAERKYKEDRIVKAEYEKLLKDTEKDVEVERKKQKEQLEKERVALQGTDTGDNEN